MSVAELSRRLGIDRKSVYSIIKAKGEIPASNRKDQIELEEELLRATFTRCNGWAERVHEILQEKGINIGYSTLTRKIRDLGLRASKKDRSGREPDEAGAEFQHDTSPYVLEIGAKKLRVQASQLYYRYSKVRYLKFYPSFTRFHMKSFLHEALLYFGYTCKKCIIDNTNLAIKSGTGKNAIPQPEMKAFADMYGFEWLAHELGHSDRKAGVERAFWTIETNFFPGREFASLEDLNRQAFEWCEKRTRKLNRKTRLIPAELFEQEKEFMEKIPSDLPAPYLQHNRSVDQYGYIAFDANYYWVPYGTDGTVIVLQYADSIKIYNKRKMMVEYAMPHHGTRLQCYSPKGMKPANLPKKVAIPTDREEAELKSLSPEMQGYMARAFEGVSRNRRYILARNLYGLYRHLGPALFLKTIKRSMEYGVYDVRRLEAVSIQILGIENYEMPEVDVCYDFEKRPDYLQGEYSDPPDLESYDRKYRGGNDGQET